MWFITLVLLAIAAFFIVLIAKSKGDASKGASREASAGEPPAQTGAAPGTTPGAAPGKGSDVSSGVSAAGSRAAAPVAAHATHEATSAGATATGFTHPSGDSATDIREMLKILNLRATDAGRLGISKAQYTLLEQGQAGELDRQQLQQVSRRLESMLT